MKKLFTLFVAALASVSLTTAQTTYSLIKEDGSLNSDEFFGGVDPTAGEMTFEDVVCNNYIKFGSTTSTPSYAANKTVGYNCKSSATDVKIYVTNTNKSNKLLYITTFDEAAAAFASETITVAKDEAKVITQSYTNTTNKTIYLHVNSTDVKIYKFDATETGEALKQAGEVGYSLNFNKGRFCAPASTEKASAIDGMSFFGISSNYTPNSSAELQLKSVYADGECTTLAYVGFTAKEDCQLRIKDNNGKGYWVSKTLAEGAAEDLIIGKDTAVDITAGQWYIISSNKGAIKFNLIEFLAPDLSPALAVSKASVDLNLTAANPAPSAKVVFSGKNLAAGTYNLVVPNLAGLTVNPQSVTVGEDGKLNAEVTIAYTSDVDVAAASSEISLTIGELKANVAINYSASLTKKYLEQSVNIEQIVMDNGVGYDIKAAFDALNIEYNNIDALDSLNDDYSKTDRNYAFLGLKLKKADASLSCWVKANTTIRVKFGNVGADFKVAANGVEQTLKAADYANTTVDSNKELSLTVPTDMYLQIICNSTKTLVVKQIMINEEIKPVVLPEPSVYTVTCADAENGAVTLANGKKQGSFAPGATVELTLTPAAGYLTYSLTYNSKPLYYINESLTFVMPAEPVSVEAVFVESFPTALDNVDASVKAVKVIQNGQLLIKKGDVLYNAQGAMVR